MYILWEASWTSLSTTLPPMGRWDLACLVYFAQRTMRLTGSWIIGSWSILDWDFVALRCAHPCVHEHI